MALGVLVAIHELGHLFAARAFRIRVLRYSIGFGPPIFTWKPHETAYTLGALPLGGFVQIHGMSPHEEGASASDPRVFFVQRPWKRILVLLSGSALNYALALVVLWALYAAGTRVAVPMTVGLVEPSSEAARAQIRPGDRIVSVDGVALSWSDLVDLVNDRPGQTMIFEMARGEEIRRVPIAPRADENGVGHVGVAQQYVYREFGPLEAAARAFQHANGLFGDGVRTLVRLARGRRGVELSTPVGIVTQASEAWSLGMDAFLRILAGISVGLAIFNLLPLPALDGGRIIFAAVEGLSRRKVSPELETVLHAVGFIALLAVLAVVAARDIRKLLPRSPSPAADAGFTGNASAPSR